MINTVLTIFSSMGWEKKWVWDIVNAELQCTILHDFSLLVGLIYYDR